MYLAFLYARIAVGLPSPGEVIAGAQGIEVLDRKGRPIQSFDDEPGSGRVVPLAEISPFLINATLATEDAEFWDNPGVNFKGIARAVYENIAFWETGGLFQGSGGSSITQQLAKNLYVKPEDRIKRSPTRKLKETMVAFELTRRYSKEQILEWYLSNIYYGNGSYGIESASFRYLNKPPSELTLAEAALLAGLPRSPNYYDPIANVENARARQQEVLSLMVRHGFIDQAAMDTAMAEQVILREGRAPGQAEVGEDLPAPHFAQYVRELVPALIGPDKVEGNLVVTTTLDLDLQAKAVTAVNDQLDELEANGVTNGALVAMNPSTGEILAMVGSHDFFRDDISGQVNNALALNQPGSTTKPITYLAAFMDSANPDFTVVDEPIPWGADGEDRLGNADGRYRGQVTLRTALGSSLNVPAVKTLQSVGLGDVASLARRLGITSVEDEQPYGAAFTLGAYETSLLDMTYVYSSFANRGQQAGVDSVLGLPEGNRSLDPIAILKIETSDGEVLYQARPKTTRVAPEDKVYMLTSVLSDDNARQSMFGLNSPLKLPRPAAVKSGSSDETRDAWTIGYTPQLVAGVWVGNANNAPIPNGTSTFTAAPIWHNFMVSALEGQPALQFQSPGQTATATPRPQSPTPQVSPSAGPIASTNTPRPNASNTPRPNATNTPPPAATNTPRPQPTSPPPPTATPRPPATSTPAPQATSPVTQGTPAP
jgi:membrane peptidoglycan carboxypeptidase